MILCILTGSMRNFTLLNSVHMAFVFLLGFAGFLLQLRMLYILRYIKMIATLAATLTKSVKKLLSVGFIFVVVFCAFATLLYCMYGRLVAAYSSFMKTSSTLTILAIGFTGWDEFIVETGFLGIVVSISYAMIILAIVTNLFVIILLDFLAAMKQDRDLHKDNEVIDYIINIMRDMLPGERRVAASKYFLSYN